MSLWNIVVPGLAADIAEHLTDEGEVICINAALNHVPRCGWWVCYDAPNDLHMGAIEKCKEFVPRVVTEQNRDKAWRAIVEKWPIDQQPSIIICKWQPVWFAAAIKIGPRYSTFLAMMWALQGGATEIRIHGCTMQGVGYCDTDANELMRVRQRNPRYWNSRWEKERAMMNAAQKACRERRIGFEVMEVSNVKRRKVRDQREK
jgi:hypothetical protein